METSKTYTPTDHRTHHHPSTLTTQVIMVGVGLLVGAATVLCRNLKLYPLPETPAEMTTGLEEATLLPLSTKALPRLGRVLPEGAPRTGGDAVSVEQQIHLI